MLDALNYADSKGVVFVTAAGNVSAEQRRRRRRPPGRHDLPGQLPDAQRAGRRRGRLVRRPGQLLELRPDHRRPRRARRWDRQHGAEVDRPERVRQLQRHVDGHPLRLGDGRAPRRDEPRDDRRAARRPRPPTVKPLAQLNGLLISPGVVDPLNALLDRTPLAPRNAPPEGRDGDRPARRAGRHAVFDRRGRNPRRRLG